MRASDISRLLRGKRTGPGKYIAKCPAHPDRTPSLSIRDGRDAVLLKCWPGCTVEDVVAAMGLKMSDLWYDKNRYVAPEVSQRIKSERRLEDLEHELGLVLFLRVLEPWNHYWQALDHFLSRERKELIFSLYPLRKAAYDFQVKVKTIGWDRIWEEFWKYHPDLDKANPVVIPDQQSLF